MRPGRYDATSVVEYDTALHWVLGHTEPEDWLLEPEALDNLFVHFLAAVYWLTSRKVLFDLRREFASLLGA